MAVVTWFQIYENIKHQEFTCTTYNTDIHLYIYTVRVYIPFFQHGHFLFFRNSYIKKLNKHISNTSSETPFKSFKIIKDF